MQDIHTLPTPGETDWFVQERFGLFIHWGLYSLAARHEWVKCHERMDDERYEAYFRHFDPDLYDPGLWADAAAGAGMKYFVVTTKHHEGFCLWDTKLTDYKAPNSPAGRDLLRPMIEAFRARGLRTGLYHSLLDWHHPHYRIDPYSHPQREHPERAKLNESRDQDRYAEYLRAQVRELLSEYGPVDILWTDFSFRVDEPEGKGRAAWQSEKLYAMIRELQPKIILNDRLDLDGGWDVKTPEQYQPRSWVTVDGQPVVWEACQTFSGSWGYHRDESTWKSVNQLLRMLVDTVSKGGNLLLNVGPTGRGEFDARALERLEGIGRWMRLHGRSIYGCTQAPADIATPEDCRLTWNPATRRLYVHVLAWPFDGHLHLDGLAGRVEYAQLLNDASECVVGLNHMAQAQKYNMGENTLTLRVPVQQPPVELPVIELFMK